MVVMNHTDMERMTLRSHTAEQRRLAEEHETEQRRLAGEREAKQVRLAKLRETIMASSSTPRASLPAQGSASAAKSLTSTSKNAASLTSPSAPHASLPAQGSASVAKSLTSTSKNSAFSSLTPTSKESAPEPKTSALNEKNPTSAAPSADEKHRALREWAKDAPLKVPEGAEKMLLEEPSCAFMSWQLQQQLDDGSPANPDNVLADSHLQIIHHYGWLTHRVKDHAARDECTFADAGPAPDWVDISLYSVRKIRDHYEAQPRLGVYQEYVLQEAGKVIDELEEMRGKDQLARWALQAVLDAAKRAAEQEMKDKIKREEMADKDQLKRAEDKDQIKRAKLPATPPWRLED